MALLILSLSGCSDSGKEVSKEELCENIKEAYCDKLQECNGYDSELCLQIAATDKRCEESEAPIAIIENCLTELRSAICEDGVPDICKEE